MRPLARLFSLALVCLLNLGWDEPPAPKKVVLRRTAGAVTTAKAPIYNVAFSPDGKSFAVSGFEHIVHLRNVPDLSEKGRLLGHRSDVFETVFTPDGKSALTASRDGIVWIWRVADGTPSYRFSEHRAPAQCVAVSPDGKTVASGEMNMLRRGRTLLWDIETGKVRKALPFTGGPQDVEFSRDGKTLAVGSVDGTTRLFDSATGETTRTIKGHKRGVTNIAFVPDGKRIVTSASDLTVRVFDATDGRELHKIDQKGRIVAGLAVSPDGALLAVTDVGLLRIFRLSDMSEALSMNFGKQILTSAAFSPDGKSLAVVDNDGAIMLYEVVR